MKRRIIQVLFLTVSFLVVPPLMQAEGTGEAENKTLNSIGTLINGQTEILESTLNESADIVEVVAEGTAEISGEVTETVDTNVRDASEIVKQTETNLSEAESKTIPDAVNQTTKTVENTVENVKSLVGKTTKTTKETIKSTREVTKNIPEATNKLKDNLEKTADAVIEELPQIPVVTPIVKKVKDNGLKTADAIETKMEESLENKVEQIKRTTNLATEVVNQSPEEVPIEHAQLEVVGTKNEKETVSGQKDTLSGMEIQRLVEFASIWERFDQKSSQEITVKAARPRELKQPSQSKPEKPSQHKPMEITLNPPTSMSSSYSTASSTSNPGVSDGMMAVLVLPFHESGLSRESWKPGNKFALKQWIYDPLGQPPKFTPFLHLI